MQCGELIYRKTSVMTQVADRHAKQEKETIHSGHFMVSHFEAEAQDDEDDLAVPVPEEEQTSPKLTLVGVAPLGMNVQTFLGGPRDIALQQQQLSIETSLTKLFRCMTLAYRQKLTSPKWNRFKGIKLRWKDKIRLNNVIWRCWHMQFIKKQNTLVCQFASPLDVDLHVKPETTLMEGKYWKRRAEAVKAEYKKWRMFHLTRTLGRGSSVSDLISEMETAESLSQCDLTDNMLMDEDYIAFMSDTLFSTITSNQPFAFPDTREIARGASLADFIQPSLGPLQPNLDDYMDTLEPLHDLLSASRLPPVPEECSYPEPVYQNYISNVQQGSSNQYIGSRHINQLISAPSQSPSMVKSEQSPNYSNRPYPSATSQSGITSHASYMGGGGSAGASGALPYARDTSSQYRTNLKNEATMQAIAPKMRHYPSNEGASKVYSQQMNSYAKTFSVIQQGMQQQSQVVSAPARASAPSVATLQESYPRPNVATLQESYPRDLTRPRSYHHASAATAPYNTAAYKPRESAIVSPVVRFLAPQAGAEAVDSRYFKMPSPPHLAAPPHLATPHHQSATQHQSTSSQSALPPKENFRSSSLPVGTQLNPDWTLSFTNQAASRSTQQPSASASHSGVCSPQSAVASRARSRSSSVSGRAPLLATLSEPALPQASVLRAHLLTNKHSQSMYKLSCSSGGLEDVTAAPGEGHAPCPAPAPPTPPTPHSERSRQSGSVSPPPVSPASPRRDPRRTTHLHAEHKRRCNIKNGFDTLHSLIPHLNNNPNAKVSKAAMLHKGAEYIKQLKAERGQIKEEMDSLRQQIECLNNSISNCHSLLPATGAPVSRGRTSRLREMFAAHVASRTAQDWKYWLFSVVVESLVSSFSSCVSGASARDLRRTTLLWAEQHCSLVEMRPAVLSALRVLCTSTDILSSPHRLPEEARARARTLTHTHTHTHNTHDTLIKTEPL